MTTRNCSLLAGVALAAVWLCGTPSFAAETVVMSAAQEKAVGIRLATAVAAEATPIATVPASVSPPMNGRRIVASPFAGTVIQVNVLEGQSVKAGAALAVLFSRDALTVVAREVVNYLRDSDEFVPALLPVGDGLAVAVKR